MGGRTRTDPEGQPARPLRPGFVIRPEGESDIAEAYDWYEAHSPGLGEEFLAAVDEALAAVRQTPQRFPRVHEEPDFAIRRARLKRFPYGLHFLWTEAPAAARVIACMHAQRDPRRWLRRA